MYQNLDEMCRIFWREWRKVYELAPPWDTVHEQHRIAITNGIKAILEKINEENKEQIRRSDTKTDTET